MYKVIVQRIGAEARTTLWEGARATDATRHYEKAVRRVPKDYKQAVVALLWRHSKKWIVIRRFNSEHPVGSPHRNFRLSATTLGDLKRSSRSSRGSRSSRRRHADLGPQAITRPSTRPGLVDVVLVNSVGSVLDVLGRNLPYARAVQIIRSRPL